MKKIVYITVLIFCIGCASGNLRMDSENLKSMQMTEDGEATSGCVTNILNASSGIIGGSNRVIVIWGELNDAAINWCTGR